MHRQLRDLIEIIHFTENVSAKIHGLLDEREIYRTVSEEFAKSQRYTATILLLTDDGAKLGIAETSISAEKVKAGEKAAGVRLQGYKIDLEKSTTYSQVVGEGTAVQVNVSDIIGELFPRPLAYLISKIMGYEKSPSILTALKRRGKTIGVLAMTSADLAEYFIPSVRSLAQHISIALELADEQAERKRAEEELREYRDHLEELVEERSAELIKANKQLQREISERQRAEEALRESEERYRGLFGGVPVGINLTTPEGQIIDANPALVEMLGYLDRESLLAVNATHLYVDPDGRQRWQALIEREGVMRGFEVQLRRRDGTTIWVESNARAVCDADGRVAYYEGTLEDISERKRAEESLRESEKRYRSFVQNFQGIAYRGSMDFAPIFLHGAVEAITGYAEDNFTAGKLRWDHIIHPEDLPNIFTDDERKLHSIPNYSYEREYRILREDGQMRWVHETTQNVCDDSGKPVMVQGAIYDITERRQAEEVLRQRTAQLEAVRQVGLEIAAELDLDSLLHSIVLQAVELVEAAEGSLYLYRPDLDVLGLVMAVGPHLPRIGTVVHRGEGLCGKVWESGEPLIVDDYQQWEGLVASYEGYPWTAALGVPVHWGEKFLGVLNVLADRPVLRPDRTKDPHTFSLADAELLSLLATQSAIAIRNASLFEGEQEQRELAEALEEAAAIVSSTLDPDQVLDRILEQVNRVVPNDATNIMLIEDDQARVVRWRGYERFGAEEFVSAVVFNIPEVPGLRRMVESGEPMVIPDTVTYPGWVTLPVTDWLRSYAAAPIVVRGDVIGFLNVDSATPDFFLHADAVALRAFADHAATAIENARLHQAEQERRHIAETLRQASTVLSSTLELDEVLGLILQQLRQAIPYDSASVQRLQEGRLEIVACLGFEETSKVVGLAFPLDPKFPNHVVVTTKSPLAIEDVVQDYVHFKDEADAYESGRIRSWLGVPLMVKGEVIGMIAIDRTEVRPYTTEEVELATTFANQAAVTVENARLYESAQQEISERRRAEEELRESEQKHRTLIEQSLQGIIIGQGPGSPRLVFANPAMADILGYTVDELTSLSPKETAGLVHPEDREFFFQRFADRLEDKAAAARYEVRGIRKDGTLRWLEISASRIEYQGQPAVQAAFVDITERRIAERALERRATQLATVGEIGRQIASILNPDELLRQTVNLLEDAFGYLFVYIFLLDEDSKELVLRAGAGAARRTLEGTRLAIEARSINTFVSRTGEPLLANDVSQEPMYLLLAGVADTKSELAVPIKVKDRVIGTLDVQSTELNAFDESDLFTLQALASQVAIAIENARLYEEARQRIGELAGLHELSQAFSSVTDVRETYGELTKRIAKLIGCQACTIATYDHRSREMRAQPPGYGAPDEVVQSFRYSVDGQARDAWNFRLRGPLVANDIAQIPDFFRQWLAGFDVFNLLIVPMALEGKITGLVYAANKPEGFAEGDSRLLTIFASQAAVIIENARLYGETRRWAEEMTSVYNVGVATTSTLNVDEVLNLVCEQVRHLLEVSSFYIALYDAEKEELCFELALDDGVPLAKFTRKLSDGAGLSGWIIRSKQPLLIRDAERDELPAGAIVVGLPARSWLGVPLLYLNRVVGVMGVQSYQPNAFDESDQELLSTIATQVATAIENARLFTETNGRAKDLALLLGTSTAISSSLDLDQILNTVARQIITSLVATFCRITLLDDTGEKLIIRAVYPIRNQEYDDLGRQCPLGVVPWHKRVIETGEAVILRQDVPELTLSDEECEMVLTEGVQSAALIPLIVGGRMLGVISLGEERSWGRSPFTSEKVSLCQSIAAQAAVAIENARLYEELRQSFLQTIAALAAAVDAKDTHTGGHSQRTTELAAAIAQELELSEAEIELIRYAGLLHDLGKIGISEQILGKPGPLDAEEWEAVRRHPALGANIVERAAALQQLVPVIMHHHERYDGRGYPARLRGEDIPFKARILSVADAYEAMTSDRAYRLAMTVEQALATLREGADKQWDGKVVDVLCRIIQERGDEA